VPDVLAMARGFGERPARERPGRLLSTESSSFANARMQTKEEEVEKMDEQSRVIVQSDGVTKFRMTLRSLHYYSLCCQTHEYHIHLSTLDCRLKEASEATILHDQNLGRVRNRNTAVYTRLNRVPINA